MKHHMLIVIGLVLNLAACSTSYNPEMLNPTYTAIETRLSPLTATLNDASKFDHSSAFFKMFENELDQNILIKNSDNKKYGSIELSILYLDENEQGGRWLAVISGLSLMTFNILGMPAGYFDNKLNVDVSIYNNNKALVKKYSYYKSDRVWVGLYYDRRKVSQIELMRSIIEDLKADLNRDSGSINAALVK